MYKWYLPTLGEILQSRESAVIQSHRHKRPLFQAEQEWYGAIAALNTLLSQQQQSQPTVLSQDHTIDGLDGLDGQQSMGLILSGPFPMFTHANFSHQFAHWTLTGDAAWRVASSLRLPPADAINVSPPAQTEYSPDSTLSLHPDDPLAVEPFCLVLSPDMSMVVTLGLDETNTPQCFYSFDPDTVWQSWRAIQSRIQLTHPAILPQMNLVAQQFSPIAPDYHTVMEFSQLMLMHISAQDAQGVTRQRSQRPPRRHRHHHQHHHHQHHNQHHNHHHNNRHGAHHRQQPHLVKRSLPHPEPLQSEPSQALQSNARYPHKSLNVNPIERFKLEDVSWQDVVPPPASSHPHPLGEHPSAQPQAQPVAKNIAAAASPSASSSPSPSADRVGDDQNHKEPKPAIGSDIELLKAIAHEVRTPLTTIRTLTRLLLKRKELEAVVIKRLQQIDRECTQQIDRFNLIFKAVEIETATATPPPSHLAKMSLTKMFQENVSRWQQQAQQRNLTLDVVLPHTLPHVMSDPTMLDQVLTGLMDRMTYTLPPGTLIQLSVVPAGHQLKLQFWARPQSSQSPGSTRSTPCSSPLSTHFHSIFAPTLQAVGQLLMFQPETGNLSLNLDVTKNLFQSLGGKLIVRHTPQKGEVLTIFLPMDDSEPSGLSSTLKGPYFC